MSVIDGDVASEAFDDSDADLGDEAALKGNSGASQEIEIMTRMPGIDHTLYICID